eukprot:TRINITY_DN15_c0_g1_i1.p1 TRINITY_DN15_c0_g1~~TRINITY_DN15_c0_g1_i1.p1  ORF type:complete len:364 (+),score=71.13 TRINITY_DN15_c0_g1_i1:250-1341(+)
MLLRSSSTPVLGSYLSDSPSNFDSHIRPPSSSSENPKKISFLHGTQPNFNSFSCNSSPMSYSVVGISDSDRESGSKGFRRARSDGNLEGLVAESKDFHYQNQQRHPRRPKLTLTTIPSFSIYSRTDEEEEEEDANEDEEEEETSLERSVTIGENIRSVGSGFSFLDAKEEGTVRSHSLVIEEVITENFGKFDGGMGTMQPLFLARGLGIDVDESVTDGGGNDLGLAESGGGYDGSDVEGYYKKMAEENPFNALFLRNYAQFLYQTKGDSQGAEEYYSRAILAEPGDGEILSQYAKLIWELHHDHERASSYFERAVQAAPADSHVLAAYASFLWETEDDEQEDSKSPGISGVPIFQSTVASVSV